MVNFNSQLVLGDIGHSSWSEIIRVLVHHYSNPSTPRTSGIPQYLTEFDFYIFSFPLKSVYIVSIAIQKLSLGSHITFNI
jgi:hypothetical protein